MYVFDEGGKGKSFLLIRDLFDFLAHKNKEISFSFAAQKNNVNILFIKKTICFRFKWHRIFEIIKIKTTS